LAADDEICERHGSIIAQNGAGDNGVGRLL